MEGLGDAFVAKLDAPTGALLYSSFVGGTSADGGALIAFDGYGNAIIGGGTNSLDFPTTPHSFMPTPWPIPLGDCFIARLNSTGSALDFGTYFGGVEGEEIWDLRADDDGFITFCGTSHSDQAGFPTTPGAIEEDWISPYAHGFVSRLLRDGRTLAYSTAIGGTSGISGAIVTALDSDSTGAVTFGAGAGPDYPITPGAFDSVQNQSGNKAAVTRIDMLPTGVTRIGASTPGCLGPLAVGVILNPKAGTKTFEVTCTRGPKFGSGHLIVSSSKLAIPILASGATLYVDPAAATLVPVSTDDLGFARRALPLRHSLQGSKGYVQFVFPDPCAPGGWSASPALEIIVQP
ncbi:MAG: hypothetical protein IPH13_03415 [Planctomycetes bacterium]|nr:hypothetical protein [Planctomycetota bacterium]MCC7171687.1 hypothetical protein [Planctomycetota bacterium]